MKKLLSNVQGDATPTGQPLLDELLELVPVLLAASMIVGAVNHIVKGRTADNELLITLMLPDGQELSGTLSELTEALKDVEAGK